MFVRRSTLFVPTGCYNERPAARNHLPGCPGGSDCLEVGTARVRRNLCNLGEPAGAYGLTIDGVSRMMASGRTNQLGKRIGILWRGDRSDEDRPTAQECRLQQVSQALAERHVSAEPMIYSEEATAEVREQLLQLSGVLVWVNPIDGGRDRADLDALLREVSQRSVWVSAH